ncbi:UDP-2,3-diacylglucosamine diphosphatase LpxI [uncultured Maricaulis sp.]|uniref:LpxI family protein n=1 Tax=uncultured Maricaulis sp. TaxID=174710 RepID=UPI002634DEEA|nr:UDP-2,3-diacylglucosamine diphosphatase LpxI [uncultured Maricaulis sp.]
MTETGWTKLGLLAGGGDLPLEILKAQTERPVHVVVLRGFADRDYAAYETTSRSVGEIGGMIRDLRVAGCDAVCFAGYVSRPDLSSLKMDGHGLIMVPKALAAGRKGDDAVIRVVVSEFEQAGFKVVGADSLLGQEGLPAGLIGSVEPDSAQRADAAKAMAVAAEIGRLDIGQGAVVVGGVVLAVEAQEGTNAMLERVAGLPPALRGTPEARRGVLAKRPKPIQERRVDLPTIGVDTVARCAAAGLAGIVLEADGALIVDREGVKAALATHGLFLLVEAAS